MPRFRAVAAAAALPLAFAASASAHARLSPPVSLANELQLYSLAVPTEKSNAFTTKIVIHLPSGFSIDSFVPSPGWKRTATSTEVTWTGGRVPTEEDSLFQFLGEAVNPGTYTFTVQQTYSDGSIVNWSGPETAADPAPTIDVRASLGGGRSGGAAVRRDRARTGWKAAGMKRLLPVAALVALALPASASAHAYLIRTDPPASEVLNSPPATVALTYDEAVEPKFAIISVTDAQGTQETVGPVARSAANPDTLVVPLRRGLPQGWYLIYWRAISVDGHPVSGAFTYAVGPNPGPAPQFKVPQISATAVTAQLLIARWVMFLAVMLSIGLLAFRLAIARRAGVPLRALSVAFAVTSVVGLLAIPVYLDFSTANDSLRSVFDLGALMPLFRVTAFGRAMMDLWLCFALFCVAGYVALWVDRPERPVRSVAELFAGGGAALAAAGTLFVPGAAGHAAQQSPRGWSVAVDWVHLVAGSLWLGGLVGLLVLWFSVGADARVRALSCVVPRFSNVAFVSVLALLGSGTAATVFHMPALDALWLTGYGVAILVKIGLLLIAVMIASGNLLRSRPRLIAAGGAGAGGAVDAVQTADGQAAARLLARLVGGEAAIVAGAVFTAALLSSLAPPPPAFALQNSALATVGPGRVLRTVQRFGYTLQVLVAPNKAAAPDSFALRITKGGRPVTGANVTLTFNHTEMQMPQQEYQLTERRPGVYERNAPALVMVGKWALGFQITPPGGQTFDALILDQANG
jgi:copper transport protein